MHYGLSEQILSDQVRNFKHSLLAELCKVSKIKNIPSELKHRLCEMFTVIIQDMVETVNQDVGGDCLLLVVIVEFVC